VASPQGPQRLIGFVQVKRLGVELAANPFQHIFVLRMTRVSNSFQEATVAPDAAHILGGTGTQALDAHRVVLAWFRYQHLFYEQIVKPTVTEIVLAAETELLAWDDLT
jgi:hypothetical protein